MCGDPIDDAIAAKRNPGAAGTAWGAFWEPVAPSPNCPDEFWPQQYAIPEVATPQV